MIWLGVLYVFLALLVLAELFSMRSTIRDLRDEIEKINETVKQKVIAKIDKELHGDDEQ